MHRCLRLCAPLLVAAMATATLPARASSPQAWNAYGQRVLQACLALSTLSSPQAAGERVDLPGSNNGMISALLLEGTYPQAHMAGRRGLELCLYDSGRRQAQVAEADRLMLKR